MKKKGPAAKIRLLKIEARSMLISGLAHIMVVASRKHAKKTDNILAENGLMTAETLVCGAGSWELVFMMRATNP